MSPGHPRGDLAPISEMPGRPGPRRDRVGRPFRALDGVILVAAFALWAPTALELWRLWGPLVRPGRFADPAASRDAWWNLGVLVGLALGHGLTVLTMAYVAVRLRGPRPPLDEFVRQPGVIAVFVQAALLQLAAILAVALLLIAVRVPMFASVLVLSLPETARAPILLPISILGAWAIAAATGWLRPERGWIDRLGRGIGVGWSLLGVLYAWLLAVP